MVSLSSLSESPSFVTSLLSNIIILNFTLPVTSSDITSVFYGCSAYFWVPRTCLHDSYVHHNISHGTYHNLCLV